MKAWQVTRPGQPGDALELTDVPRPEPAAGQLLVRVLAAAANFPDYLLCLGTYQARPPLPFTPGIELCGEVVAIGAGVTGFAAGDRVIGGAVLPNGAFAEYAIMDAARSFPAPEGLDDAEAAPFFVTYQTGWFGLHRKARLQAGETLLVHAAAGGVGSGAVQLGKAAGARVIGVVGGPSKAAVARELGADVVIDRHAEDFVHWGLYAEVKPALIRTCQEELTRLVAVGQIKPLITGRLPLSDVPSAIGRLGAGATTGRLVFQP